MKKSKFENGKRVQKWKKEKNGKWNQELVTLNPWEGNPWEPKGSHGRGPLGWESRVPDFIFWFFIFELVFHFSIFEFFIFFIFHFWYVSNICEDFSKMKNEKWKKSIIEPFKNQSLNLSKTSFWKSIIHFVTSIFHFWKNANHWIFHFFIFDFSFLIPDLDQIGTRSGPDPEQIWSRCGPDLVPIWTRSGPDLDQIWTKSRPDWNQIGTWSGPDRDQIGTRSGPEQDHIWTRSGPDLDQI